MPLNKDTRSLAIKISVIGIMRGHDISLYMRCSRGQWEGGPRPSHSVYVRECITLRLVLASSPSPHVPNWLVSDTTPHLSRGKAKVRKAKKRENEEQGCRWNKTKKLIRLDMVCLCEVMHTENCFWFVVNTDVQWDYLVTLDMLYTSSFCSIYQKAFQGGVDWGR